MRGDGGRLGMLELTIPLPGNLVPRIAVAPWVVVHALCRIDLHVLLARTPAVQIRDRLYDLLALRRELY